MTTYNQEQQPAYEAPKLEEELEAPAYEAPVYEEELEAPEVEYQYQEYQPVAEYKPVEYWTPEYENVQTKYSGEEYAEKQYVPETDVEGYGQETADYLIANQNDNLVETYAGNDVVEAGYGSDKIDTGEGDDWLWGITKEHDATQEKYAEEEYMEIDWYISGGGKDIYALGTEQYAHYATNGAQDYAVIADYTAEDTVMLHGTAENYVVAESVTKTEDPAMMEKAATIYWDKDENGAYSEGDDMVAVFEGYSATEITAAKDNWMYVQAETPIM